MLDLIPFVYAGVGLAGIGAALWHTRRQVTYTGRHRAIGPSTMSQHAEPALRSHRMLAAIPVEHFAELADASNDPAEFDTPAQTKGAYAKLRTEELDSTAERFWRLVDKGIRPPSPWGTPMDDDDWTLPEGVEGHAIAGRTR